MNKLLRLIMVFICASFASFAQAQSSGTNIYVASAGETIFSWGNVDAGVENLNNIVRFTPFFNYGEQVHFEFNNVLGFYTGLDIRNVGIISHTAEGYKIKERSYGLGVPLVVKIGDFGKNTNIGLGGELEAMFAWKRKVFSGSNKSKETAWFSDNVNIFNPSLLAEVKFSQGFYLRYKYYLNDFLKYKTGGLNISTPVPPYVKNIPDYALSSQMMYISFGYVVSRKQMDHMMIEKSNASKSDDAYFKASQAGLK